MARRPRIEVAGFHHIYNQGVANGRIFLTSADRKKFLELLCEACENYKVVLHDYALLDDDFHLLIQTSRKNLSLFMRQLNSNYAIFFNQKYKRNGHLWQGRFKSWWIEDDQAIQRRFVYIENQPLLLHKAEHIGEYEFTLIAAIFLQAVPACAYRSRLKLQLEELGRLDHDRFVLGKADIELVVREQKRRVDFSGLSYVDEAQKSLKHYFKKSFDKRQRNRAILKALGDGYTQASLAYHLKLSTSTISKVVSASKVGYNETKK